MVTYDVLYNPFTSDFMVIRKDENDEYWLPFAVGYDEQVAKDIAEAMNDADN